MKTPVLSLSGLDSRASIVRAAAAALDSGGLVAFPTETVYGLGARADLPHAVEKLRRLKGRDGAKAFTVHVAQPNDAFRFAPDMGGRERRFLHKAWPGPVTIVADVADPHRTPAAIAAGEASGLAASIFFEHSVGLRCPDDAIALDIIAAACGPVIASSANFAGHPAPVTAEEVAPLWDQVDCVVDGGRTRYAKPSTIVRFRDEKLEVLRDGVFDSRIIDELATTRILFVCTGNTCRSPMAAGIARKQIAEKLQCSLADLSDKGLVVQSAGTSGGVGSATLQAVAAAAKLGVNLSEHRSSSLNCQTAQQADYIFVMTRTHFQAVVDMAPQVRDRVFLLSRESDIADPIGATSQEYEQCALQIQAALQERLREVEL